MITLAIETSQRAGGVALRDARGEVHVESLRPAGRYDDDLLPSIDRLLKRRDLTPRDLETIGVSVGPGGFTGLRIAVATAQAMGEALGAAVVPVPTALVVAEPVSPPGPLAIFLASKRDRAWLTLLDHAADADADADAWTVLRAPRRPGSVDATDLERLLARAPAAGAGGGEVDVEAGGEAFRPRLALADRHLPESIEKVLRTAKIPIESPSFRPESCLKAAELLGIRGGAVEPHRLRPIYAREPEAVSLWERRAAERDR